jgi:hypothetical protein
MIFLSHKGKLEGAIVNQRAAKVLRTERMILTNCGEPKSMQNSVEGRSGYSLSDNDSSLT